MTSSKLSDFSTVEPQGRQLDAHTQKHQWDVCLQPAHSRMSLAAATVSNWGAFESDMWARCICFVRKKIIKVWVSHGFAEAVLCQESCASRVACRYESYMYFYICESIFLDTDVCIVPRLEKSASISFVRICLFRLKWLCKATIFLFEAMDVDASCILVLLQCHEWFGDSQGNEAWAW